MKKYLYLLIIGFSCFQLSAQIAPSPDAMSYAGLNNPEDQYRGHVSEMAPIYSVPTSNGYQVPIQLVYQTTGIQVNEIASSVGLGWNLMAGGAITRVMRDQPDDQSEFEKGWNGQIILEDQINHEKGHDFEKDIFHFSFPGAQGKFVAKTDQMGTVGSTTNFYGLPYTDIKIEFNFTNSANSNWTLTDTYGVQYIFGTTANSRETTHSWSYKEGEAVEDNEDWTYISTWYLKEIIFPNMPSASKITFSYVTNSNNLSYSDISYQRKNDIVVDHSLVRTWQKDLNDIFEIKPYLFGWNDPDDPRPIIPISLSKSSSVYFGISNSSNYGNWKLDTDESVFDKNCTEVPDCHENAKWSAYLMYGTEAYHDFVIGQWLVDPDNFVDPPAGHAILSFGESSLEKFIANSTIVTSRLISIVSDRASVTFDWSNRLDHGMKLDKINVSDHTNSLVKQVDLNYTYFNADNCTDGSAYCKRLKLVSLKQYGKTMVSYQYTDELDPKYNLPSRKSIARDKFGFYNSDVSSNFTSYILNSAATIEYDPISRNYNVPVSQYNLSKKSAGGSDKSASDDSKSNMLWRVNYPSGGFKELDYQVKNSGGVAISSIKVFDELDNKVSHKSYSYEELKSMNSTMNFITAVDDELKLIRFSNSPYLTYDHLQVAGYKTVIAKDEINGIESETEFYTGGITDDNRKSKWKFNNGNHGWSKVEELEIGSQPIMSPNFNPFLGLVKKVIVKDEIGDIISENENFYKKTYTTGIGDQFIIERAFSFLENTSGYRYYNIGESYLRFTAFQLDYSIQANYEGDKVIHNKTRYEYGSTHPTLPIHVSSWRTNENGEIITGHGEKSVVISTRYPSSKYSINKIYSESVLDEMVSKNMIGIPVQVERKENLWDLMDVSITTFRKQHGFIQPFEVWKSTFDTPQGSISWDGTDLRKVSTSTYNEKGFLESQIGTNDIETSYLYNDQGYLLSTTIDPGVESLKRTTSYTYKPLVGVQTVTGPDGRTIKNEYDNQNRLHLVRDHEDNIIKRYRYNTAGESNEILASIKMTGINHVKFGNATVTFSPEDLQMYGGEEQAEYKWRILDKMGNQNYHYNDKQVSHAFTEAGSYIVTLTIIHPEYDVPKNTSTTLVIYDNLWSLANIEGDYFHCTNSNVNTPKFFGANINVGGSTCIPTEGFSYEWDYRVSPNGGWIDFSDKENSSVVFPEHLLETPRTYEIRVKVTDDCGTFKFKEMLFYVKSSSDTQCGGSGEGGGGGVVVPDKN